MQPADSLAAEVVRLMEPRDREADRPAFRRLLLAAEARAPRLLEARDTEGSRIFLRALAPVAALRRHWVRDPESWRAQSHSPCRQFAGLLRHLLATYPVSAVMDRVFLDETDRIQPLWFVHVAQGGNLRTAPGMPVPLTKMMAHCALNAPGDLTFLQAVRWGQVIGTGGSCRLARVVAGSALGTEFSRPRLEEWWGGVFRWLGEQPMLDPEQVVLMLNYLEHRKAADPEFTMKGRSANAVLQLAADRQRALHRHAVCRVFQPSEVAPSEWLHDTPDDARPWSMTEILTLKDLGAEGQAMGHCVFTYAGSIRCRRSSIWSLRQWEEWGPARKLTLEVSNRARKVVQVRGRFNRDPTPEERQVMTTWAAAHNLRVDLD